MDLRRHLAGISRFDVSQFLIALSLLFAATFLLIGYVSPAVFDFDLGRHLLFGRLMVENKEIINTNLLSYTNTDFRYINSHWLSEIVLYLIHNSWGHVGLIVFSTILGSGSLAVLFFFAKKRVPLVALAITLPIVVSFVVLRADIRPELFSYLFTSIFITVLYKNREKPTRWLWLLAPLQAMWVNMHIYFAVGPFLIILFLAESFFCSGKKLTQNGKGFLYAFISTSLASLLNPNHIFGALNPIFFSRNYGYSVDENKSFWTIAQEFNPQLLFPYLGLLGALALLMVRYRKRLMPIEIVIVSIFGIASVLAYRNFFLFIYLAFFTFARVASFALEDIWRSLKRNTSTFHAEIIQIAGLVLLCLTIFSFSMGVGAYVGGLGLAKVERGKSAVDFFIDNKLEGPIYNGIEFGQYLASRLYPDHLVYVDGRPEAYPSEFFSTRYTPSHQDPVVFQQEDERYNFNVAFIYLLHGKIPPITNHLIQSNDYVLVYFRPPILLFVKNTPKNQSLIDKYRITDTTFSPAGDERTGTLAQYVMLFDAVGWPTAAQVAMSEITGRNPSACGLKLLLKRDKVALSTVELPQQNDCLGFGWWW